MVYRVLDQRRLFWHTKNSLETRSEAKYYCYWTYLKLNILICSLLVDRKVLTWLTWSVHKVWEIMSEHSIKCSCDGLLLYDTRLCPLEWPDMAICIWRIYSPACVKLRQPQGFWNSFRNPCKCLTIWEDAETCSQTKSRRRNRNHSLVPDKMFCKSWVVYIHLITSFTFKYLSQN